MKKTSLPVDVVLPSLEWVEDMLLGVALSYPALMSELSAQLQADDFSTDWRRLVWTACTGLFERGSIASPRAVWEELFRSGMQAEGSLGRLIDLADSFNAPELSPISISEYVSDLRNFTQRRKAIFLGNALMAEASARNCVTESMLAGAMDKIAEIGIGLKAGSEFKSTAEVLRDSGGLNHYVPSAHLSRVIETPFPRLNSFLLRQGFEAGTLNVIAAHTSRGKSAFAVNLALHAAQNGKRVAVVSLEMEQGSVYDRLLSLESRLDGYHLSRSNRDPIQEQERREKIRNSAEAVNALSVWISYQPGLSPKKLATQLKRVKATSGLDFVIVDYLQLMSMGDRTGNRAEEVAQISRALTRIAGDLSVPVLALSQFSRESAKQEREPRLDDLRESGAIEQDAATVLFLHVTRMWNMADRILTGDVKLMIAKQRNGAANTSLMFQFHAPTGEFSEL